MHKHVPAFYFMQLLLFMYNTLMYKFHRQFTYGVLRQIRIEMRNGAGLRMNAENSSKTRIEPVWRFTSATFDDGSTEENSS